MTNIDKTMDENEKEELDLENEPEKAEEKKEEPKEEVDVEALKKENATLKAQKDHWKKKAEEKPKVEPKQESPKTEGLTAKDVLVLSGEGITHEEDVDIVQRWARFNNMEVKDALKDNTLKTVLAENLEKRKTASITQTKGGAKGVNKVSGEDLLRKAEKGEFPESEEDINKMLDAKFEAKKSALKR